MFPSPSAVQRYTVPPLTGVQGPGSSASGPTSARREAAYSAERSICGVTSRINRGSATYFWASTKASFIASI